MTFLSRISDEMVVADIFNWSPEASQCISEWHQIVLRGASPLSIAEREVIGAYTLGVNSCELCYGVHKRVSYTHLTLPTIYFVCNPEAARCVQQKII